MVVYEELSVGIKVMELDSLKTFIQIKIIDKSGLEEIYETMNCFIRKIENCVYNFFPFKK